MNSYLRQSAVPADQMHSFLKDKQAWENAIALHQGPDPLDHWWNYICWYENHGHGDPDNKFRETLERCLTLYEHSDYYKQDVRMVRLWLKYIDMQNNPLHFYQVLHQRGVGKQVACFYVGWATYYESVNAFKEAEAVYNLAFQEKAQPYADLHHGHSKLMYSKAMHAQAQQQQMHQNQHMQYQSSSAALQSANNNCATPSTATNANNMEIHQQQQQQQSYRQQISYHHAVSQPQQLQQQPISHPPTTHHHNQHPIAPQQLQTHVYHNVPTQNHYPPQQNLQDAQVHHQHPHSQTHEPLNAPQQKESIEQVSETSVYNTQQKVVHTSHQPHNVSTQQIQPQQVEENQSQQLHSRYEQVSYSVPIEQQLPAATTSMTRQQYERALEASAKRNAMQNAQKENGSTNIQVLSIRLPKRFASYSRNNHETWQPALFLEEPDDPQKICHYAKSTVYPPNLSVEYSPEEIKARIYQRKMDEWKRESMPECPSQQQYQSHDQVVQDQGNREKQNNNSSEAQQNINSQMQEIGSMKTEATNHQQQQTQQFSLQHQQQQQEQLHHNNNNLYYQQQNETQIYHHEQHPQTIQTQIDSQSRTQHQVQQQYHINHYEHPRYQQKINHRQHEHQQHQQQQQQQPYSASEKETEGDQEEEGEDDNQDTEDEQQYNRQVTSPIQQQLQNYQYQPTVNSQNLNSLDGEGDLEDQIEASTIRFSMHTPNKGSQNKTLKIKFKKERPSTVANTPNGNNYSAYTIERIYQPELDSPTLNENVLKRNGNNNSFHPYLLGQTSTPKTSAKRQRAKLKKPSNKFQMLGCSNSNSSSAENGHTAANSGYITESTPAETSENKTHQQHSEHSVQNANFNDNANYSFSSAVALENSNCSLSNAVGRLNFREATALNSSTLNQSHVADISTYQENSYFSTQNDAEAKELRLSKALETIERHMAKEAIDPFSSELCRAFLTKLDFPGANGEAHDNYKIIQTPLPKIANARQLNLSDGIQFNIDKEIGRGSYGSVYKANDVATGAVVALKFQKPANTWEIYICDQVLKRVKSPNILPGLMDISTAIIAPNASLIATEFSPYGSLLDINNKIRQATTKVMHESLVMHFSAQICNIIYHLHQNKIIHADIKPDNFLLMRVPSTDLHFPSLRLIDFGCAIDMTLFPEGDKTKFRKVIQTDGFTCIEMQEGRSWSYETDLFCIAGTVHVMLFGEYMQLQKRAGTWDIKQKLPRYLKKHVWNQFFGDILNIKPEKSLPDLRQMKNIFDEEASRMDSELQKQMRTLSNILHRR